MPTNPNSPSHQIGQLRRALIRYRAGLIDASVLAKQVERFLEWDNSR